MWFSNRRASHKSQMSIHAVVRIHYIVISCFEFLWNWNRMPLWVWTLCDVVHILYRSFHSYFGRQMVPRSIHSGCDAGIMQIAESNKISVENCLSASLCDEWINWKCWNNICNYYKVALGTTNGKTLSPSPKDRKKRQTPTTNCSNYSVLVAYQWTLLNVEFSVTAFYTVRDSSFAPEASLTQTQ